MKSDTLVTVIESPLSSHALDLWANALCRHRCRFLLAVAINQDAPQLQLVFDQAVYSAQSVQQLGEQLVVVLGALAEAQGTECVSNSCMRVADVPWVSQSQQKALFALATSSFDQGDANEPTVEALPEKFFQWGAQAPGQLAVVDGDCAVTYHQLSQYIDCLAAVLQSQHGVTQETRVAFLGHKSLASTVAMMATMLAGGAIVPIDCQFPADRVAYILHDSGCQVLLTTSTIIAQVPAEFQEVVVDIDGYCSVDSAQSSLLAPVTLAPQDLAYIIYTSGTTGRPKGVPIYHHGLMRLVQQDQLHLCPSKGTRLLHAMGVSFDGYVFTIGLCLDHQGTLFSNTEDLISAAQQAQTALLAPSMLSVLDPHTHADLKSIATCGEALPYHLAQAWVKHCPVYNGYGPSEATVMSHSARVHLSQMVIIGRLIALTICYILEMHQNIVEYLGRIDDQVKVRGYRIKLNEMTHTLVKYKNVHQLIEYVAPNGNNVKDATTFAKTLSPHYMVPAAIVTLGSFPLTPVGKIDLKALPKHTFILQSTDASAIPRTAMEDQLIRMVAQVLNIPQETVSSQDRFFQLGGDSLGAIRFSALCHDRELKLTIPRLFERLMLSDITTYALEVADPSSNRIDTEEVTAFALLSQDDDDLERTLGTIAHQLNLSRTAIEDVLPTPSLQEGFVINTLNDPSAYMVQQAFELTGDLDVKRCQNAWQAVCWHHAILRTKFAVTDHAAPFSSLRVVTAHADVAWHHDDCPTIDRSDISEFKQAWLAKDRAQGFHLDDSPLVRLTLVAVEPNLHVLLWSFHHALLDMWSVTLALAVYHGQSLPPTLSYSAFIHHVAAQDPEKSNASHSTAICLVAKCRQQGFTLARADTNCTHTIAQLAQRMECQSAMSGQELYLIVSGLVRLTPIQRDFLAEDYQWPQAYLSPFVLQCSIAYAQSTWQSVVAQLLSYHDMLCFHLADIQDSSDTPMDAIESSLDSNQALDFRNVSVDADFYTVIVDACAEFDYRAGPICQFRVVKRR
ncbi:hypothetical protein H4R35_003603 [Dimargaris xerosporica]|nr:hypothetical protein H4R35_003603 [Dimargaris xerosporica]